MTDNTPGQVPEALDDLYLKLHGLSKHLESSGRIDESDAPEAYPAILDAMNLVRRLQSEAAQVPATTAQPVQDYAELLESDEHIGTEERNEIAAELRRLHAQVAALTAQPAAPQGVAEVNWWEADGDKYDASISPMQPAQGVDYAELPAKIEPREVRAKLDPTANPDEYALCVGADMWNACVDATQALRASHGQAPATQQGAADGFFLLLPQRPKPEAPAGTAGLGWDAYSGAQMLAFGRDCSDAAIAALRTQQPAPATQQAGEVVAYLDIGAGGYLDLGAALSDEALQQLPKGRHALVIAGTYGIDGYVAAPQPSPTAQAAPAAGAVAGPDWKLVPVKPTPEMLRAGDQKTWVLPALDCWRAMLAAAPTPAAQADSVLEDAARLEALHAAVTAIYFDDSSDFKSALGAVVRHLDPKLAGDLLAWPKRAYDISQARLDAARKQ